jgi:hypothetical protein
MVGANFAIYSQQEGGMPLWSEEQNVELDAKGDYTALLGSTKNEGVPVELFAAGEPRWLQVTFSLPGEVDAPRTLLVSVPYALKAADSDTLGGKPASAYALAGSPASGQPAGPSRATQPAQPETAVPAKTAADAKPAFTSTGTTNYIAKFTDASGDIANSGLYQSGANFGIGTTAPGQLLTLQTSAPGYTFLENLVGTVDPGVGATRLEVGNPASSLMLTAYGSGAPGILKGSAGVVSLAGPFLVGSAGTGDPLYLYAGNKYTAPQFTITSAGNIGIGTETPATTLEVNGNLQLDAGGTLPQGGIIYTSGSAIGSSGSVPVIQFQGGLGNNFSAGLQALPNMASNLGATAVGDFALTSANGTLLDSAFGVNALNHNTTGSYNTAIGADALSANISGSNNTATGYAALSFNTATNNTATGYEALEANTSGNNDTATGSSALINNTMGNNNTAVGTSALESNTIGNYNTATGDTALAANIGGNYNTATGYQALNGNTSGNNNTATGWNALGVNNNTGSNNTASGVYALGYNTIGYSGTATGHNALNDNTTGNFNTATGDSALKANTSGGFNTAIGASALQSNVIGSNNTAVGNQALINVTGSSNIALGAYAGSAVLGGGNNIDIGSTGASGDNAVINLGTQGTQTSAYIAGIYGVNANGVAVYINSNGQLGTVQSSRRYKEDIQDMGAASDGLMRLRPVTFRYKKPFTDGSQPMQYGLIAEEVAEVYPDLVARSADGQIETVKYQLLDPMLLNELQKQNATIASQKEQIGAQAQQIRSLEERMEKLEAASKP